MLIHLRFHRSVLTLVGAISAPLLIPSAVNGQCGVSWTQAATSGPTIRAYPGLAYDPVGSRVLLYGGGTSSAFRRDLWQWSGSAWSLLDAGTGVSPGAREATQCAYDTARQRLVVYGGAGVSTTDTWEWNGSAWTQVSVVGPTARGFGAMVYDTARSVCIFFGGWSGGFNYFSDTQVWNGAAWSAAGLSGPVPPARAFNAMAYDPDRARAVMFGGLRNDASGSTYMGDTWEWDGVQWAQINPPISPGVRAYHSMAYDPVGRRTILYGGFEITNGVFTDTWAWDGTSWTQLAAAAIPFARQAAGLTFDIARGNLVLFGGVNGGTYRNDTWTGTLASAPVVSSSPQSAGACPTGTAPFAVTASGSGTLTYQWQIQTAPGTWATLGNDPMPLPCGGFAFASNPFSSQTPIGVHPCAGILSYQIRCVASNTCGSATSNQATYSICLADSNCDHAITPSDVATFVNLWFTSLQQSTLEGDFDGDGQVLPADVASFVSVWFAALQTGC